jgi:alanine racemase
MVDLTDIPGVAEGDGGTLLGSQVGKTFSPWDHARFCGTIPYEILCSLGSRVPRIYVDEGALKPVRSRFE